MFEDQLKEIFKILFDINEREIEMNDSPSTIPQWDSLAHLKLIIEIEDRFKIKFKTEEIPELVTVKKILDRIYEIKTKEEK